MMMASLKQIREFVLAGNALFTVKSLATGKHFTFKVLKSDGPPTSWDVTVLNGRDNTRNYTWIGRIPAGGSMSFLYSVNSPAESTQGFNWFWRMVRRGTDERFQEQCEFMHCGRCGRCGRLLTTPESVSAGIGPECRDKIDFENAGGAEGLLNQLFGG